MMPLLEYFILTASTTLLIGLPIGMFLRTKGTASRIRILAIVCLVFGIIIIIAEYSVMINWCYSLEEEPYNVSCMNFLPEIIGTFIIGLLLAILTARVTGKK